MATDRDAAHQHRFTPGPITSAGIPRLISVLSCRCGARCELVPGIPTRSWRWRYLTERGVRREWRKTWQ